MFENLIPIVSIIGPTASGKTDLSIHLARKFNGEIISADSMQIYKEFNILTSKPDKEQLHSVTHYMIDILSVVENFSVAKFVDLGHQYIRDVYSKGKMPFLVGGTGLYVDSLLNNTQFENFYNNSSDIVELSDMSNEELMNKLKEIDLESANKIHINDRKRLRRAIEFFYSSGYPISKQVEKSHCIKSPYKACKIGLNFRNRDLLYERINLRVDRMFERGLVEETRNLTTMSLSDTACGAIGYKELLPFLRNECSEHEVKENLKRATRRYAKRQLTWFKRDKEINWVYCDEHNNFSTIIDVAKNIIDDFFRNKFR